MFKGDVQIPLPDNEIDMIRGDRSLRYNPGRELETAQGKVGVEKEYRFGEQKLLVIILK